MNDAVSCFKEGFSCSSAILSTYGEQFGLNRELALKLPAVFGAGMGMWSSDWRPFGDRGKIWKDQRG